MSYAIYKLISRNFSKFSLLQNNVTNSVIFRTGNSLEGASCFKFFQNNSNAYMKYLFQQHDFFDIILLLKGNHVWIISSNSDCKFSKQVKKFIKEKKDNSLILQLHLLTLSRKHLNVKEKLYMKVLKKAIISNQDFISMLTSD